MKKGFWIIIALMLMATITCSIGPTKDQENSATVVEVVNQVDAHPRPKDDWEPAEVDMAVFGGGQVRTGAESSAQLKLLEGVVRLSAESIFTVKESAEREGRLETTLFLEEGRLWAHLTTSQPHEFRVETASAVAAVHDTHCCVQVGPDQTTSVSVAEGEVEVTAQGESVTVVTGQQTIVKPGQPPGLPEPMSDEECTLWATEGEMPELAPPTATPKPSGRLTSREDAVTRLIEEVIEPSNSREWADAYGLPEPLAEGVEVWPHLSKESIPISEPTWLFWVDDEPHAMFAHPTRIVLIGAKSNQLTVLQSEWWPVVNGQPLWANVDERLEDPNNVYRGPLAFPDPTLYPRQEPQTSNWDQPQPVMAIGGQQSVARLASYTPKTGTRYAILIAGSNNETLKKTVETMYKHLREVEGYDGRNIEMLNPVKRSIDISAAFDRIKQKGIKAGDTLIFFYAGHGTSDFISIGERGDKVGDKFWYDFNTDQEEYLFTIEKKEEVQEWERRLNKSRIENDMALKLEVPRDVYRDSKFSKKTIKGQYWVFTVGKGSKKREFRIRKVGNKLVVYAMPKNRVNRNSLAYNLLNLPKGVNVIVILQTCQAGSAIDLLKGNNMKAEILTASDKSNSAYHTPASWYSSPLSDFTDWLLSGKGNKKGDWEKGFKYAKEMIGGKSWWYKIGIGGRKNSNPQHAIVPATLAKEEVEVYVANEDGGRPLSGANVTISGKDLSGKHHTITGTTDAQGVFTTKVPRGLAFSVTASYKDKQLDCGSRTTMTPIIHLPTRMVITLRLTCAKVTLPSEPVQPAPTLTPTPEEEEAAVQTITDQVFTPTPTPAPTFTPTPTAGEYVAEGTAHLEQGCPLLKEHTDCYEGIQQLQAAIEKCTIALETDPSSAQAYFCRGMSRSCLEQDLSEAVEDLQRALDTGLEGEQRSQAEKELAELRSELDAPICVAMGPPVFGEVLTDNGGLINQNTTFPAYSTEEVYVKWDLSHPCNEEAVIKWYWDGEHECQHYRTLEEGWTWAWSGLFPDEGGFEPGTYCVNVYINDTKMTSGCFEVKVTE